TDFAANLSLTGGNFDANVLASATDASSVIKASGTTSFAADLNLFGAAQANVGATGGTINIGRDLTVDSSAVATSSTAVTAGNATVYAQGGGTIDIGGHASIYAYANGVYD